MVWPTLGDLAERSEGANVAPATCWLATERKPSVISVLRTLLVRSFTGDYGCVTAKPEIDMAR